MMSKNTKKWLIVGGVFLITSWAIAATYFATQRTDPKVKGDQNAETRQWCKGVSTYVPSVTAVVEKASSNELALEDTPAHKKMRAQALFLTLYGGTPTVLKNSYGEVQRTLTEAVNGKKPSSLDAGLQAAKRADQFLAACR